MEFEKEFKLILSGLMLEKGLTQADLCRKTEIPTSLMSNYLKGKKSPALSNAKLIAEALGVSMDDLAGRRNIKSAEEKNKDENFNLTDEENSLINLWRKLPREEQYKIIGRIEARIEECATTEIGEFYKRA